MPTEETIQLRHVRSVIGEKEDLPSLSPRVSLMSKIRALTTKIFGVPQLIHLYGSLGLNKTLTLSDDYIEVMFSDGEYLYAGFTSDPGVIIKIDLKTFTEISTLTFAVNYSYLIGLVSDGTYLYAATEQNGVVRINLNNFTIKDYLATCDSSGFQSGGPIFSDGTYLYAAWDDSLGNRANIVRISLETFTIIDTLVLTSIDSIFSMFSDGLYLYCGTGTGLIYKVNISLFTELANLDTGAGIEVRSMFSEGIYLYAVTYTNPGEIYKINLETFTIIETITLAAGEYYPVSLFADSTYLYVGLYILVNPGKIAVIDLASFTKVYTITLAAAETNVSSLYSDGIYLYAGTYTSPGYIIRKYIIPSADMHQRKIDEIYKSSQVVVTTGTHSHTNNTNEQDVVIFTATSQDISLRLDMSNITKNTTVREYEEVDNSTYRQLSAKIFPTDFDTSTKAVSIIYKQINRDYKITLQSSIVEGSAKNVVYTYRTESKG